MLGVSSLKNTYFGLRHGESGANVVGIIASGKKALTDYGLTEIGKEQVKNSVLRLKNEGILDHQTIIITSPLKRAKDTANVVAEILDVLESDSYTDTRLRERHFGIFEGQSHDAYKKVIWPADIAQKEHEHGVESTEDVKKRVLDLIEELEKKYNGKNIIFVSHGDTLQILETWFANISPSKHRSLPPLQNAEIRKYN